MGQTNRMHDITGVLLAGGKSRRMGIDKRFLKLDGETLLHRVLSVYELLFTEIVIVVAEPLPELSDSKHLVVRDLVPNCGSLGGLYTGLSVARSARIFGAACDMPFLNPAAISYLVESGMEDVVMPKLTATGFQPMHAVYSKACLPYLRHMIETRHLSIQEVLDHPKLRVRLVSEEELRSVDPELHSFLNLNTPEDAERARAIVQRDVRGKKAR